MEAGGLRLNHCWLDSENLFDPFSRENLGGSAMGDNTSATQHQDLIGKPCGEIEVVHYTYSNHISGSSETSYPLHEIDLVTNVEKRQWLARKR